MNFSVALWFRNAPDNYANLKTMIFDHFGLEFKLLKDAKVVVISNSAENTPSSVAKILPRSEPKMCDNVYVKWSNETIGAASVSTTPVERDLDHIMLPVIVALGNARGLAVYAKSGIASAADKAMVEKYLVETHAVGPGQNGVGHISRKMHELTCLGEPLRFYPFGVSSLLKIPEDPEHLQISERNLLWTKSCDYAWLAAICGHDGAACTRPCIKSERTDAEIQLDPKTAEGGADRQNRTLAMMKQSYLDHIQKHSGRKGQAKHTGSIHREPLQNL